MSRLVFTKGAAPATPAANKSAIYIDTADSRTKQIDSNGVISILNNDGLQSRNILDNGGLMIQQRVATASTAIAGISTTTRAGVVADRWAVTASVATNVLWGQVDSVATAEVGLSARYYGTITKSTAVKKVMLSQYLIANQMANLRGKKVRFSLKHNQKVGAGQVYKMCIVQLSSTGTTDAPPAFLSGAWSAVDGTDPAYSANTAVITPDASPTPENGTVVGTCVEVTSVANTWTRSSGVWTIPTNCKGLYVLFFSNTNGAATDSLGVGELQLTIDPEIVEFIQTPRMEELLRCQRFYCKTFALATVPVTNAGINTGEAKSIAGKAGAVANSGIIWWSFPVGMWRTPVTVTGYNPGAANALQRNLTGVADMGATAFTAQLDSSVMSIATGVAATAVGDQIGLHITADAEMVV